MAAISKAAALQTVVTACESVVRQLTDVQDHEEPYTFRPITAAGKTTFRFTRTIIIDGEAIEITVKGVQKSTLPPPAQVSEFLDKVMPTIS